MHSRKALRAFINGMAVLMTHCQHISFVLVSSCTVVLQLQPDFSILVLDPNVKDLYFQGQWDGEQYTAGMKQLEKVVSIGQHEATCY